MSQLPTYGEVHGPPIGEMTRRTFMRRLIGWGVGLLSLEFLAGTFAFTWPNVRGGLGGKVVLGSATDIVGASPDWATGQPYSYQKARIFLVNVPAGEALVDGKTDNVPDPKKNVLALYRKCPHLGCQIPQLCESLKRFTCNCHQSTYNILGEKLKTGPAARGMDRFEVSIGDDGGIVVDSSKVTAGAPNLGPDALTFKDPFPWDAACH